MSADAGEPSTPGPVEYVLVYGPMCTGGIETLIVRMAAHLARMGQRVSLLCGAGELVSALHPDVRILLHNTSAELRTLLRAEPFTVEGPGVVVVSFDPISAAKGLLVMRNIPPERCPVHLSGVFHPRAYFMTGERRDRVWLNRQVAAAVGFERLFFMNEECRRSHALAWKKDLSSSPLLALPISATADAWTAVRREPLRVVSVGRLVDFKAYNLGAPGIVAKCAASGCTVEWDLFGTGPMAPAIQKEIEALDVAGAVRLRGLLEYSDFARVVAGYDLFVGIGTAALEASMLGVPTICAVDGYRDACYGFLSELPYGNVGEEMQSPPTNQIAQLVKDFAASGTASRAQISGLCRAAALRYGMSDFMEQIRLIASSLRASAVAGPRAAVAAAAYEIATEGALVRSVRASLNRFRKAPAE